MSQPVRLELTLSEALVLYDWLTRATQRPDDELGDPAERRVLWDLECSLERVLVAPLAADYAERLTEAKAEVLRQRG